MIIYIILTVGAWLIVSRAGSDENVCDYEYKGEWKNEIFIWNDRHNETLQL